MKPNTQLLHTVWNNSKEFITKENVDLDKLKLDELMDSVFSNGPFYFYIVDFFDMQIKYMSPLVKDIHGLDPKATTFQDILNQIHPEDMEHVAKAEAFSWKLMYNTIEKEKRTKYKISYCFRFKTADGSYQLFNHQAVILTMDENGGNAKSINIHTNISHLTTENNYKVSAIGMFGEPSYLNLDISDELILPKANTPIFTKRETEVIKLISTGLTNEEIGVELGIATNTIKNHRKKILKKADCKNAGQLITKCMTEGLI